MSLSKLQIQTAEVFEPLLGPARFKGVYGGRASGKSHFFGGYVIERALLQPGFRAVCIREVQRSIRESVKLLLRDKIEEFGLSGLFDIQDQRIITPGDGNIHFTGMQNHTAESIKSLEGYDLAYVDEAQALSSRSIEMLTPTIRKDGNELLFGWNPTNADDPIDKLLRGDNLPPRSVVVQANWSDNPWLPQSSREELEWCRHRDPDQFAHVWEGGYLVRSEAQIFRHWRVGYVDIPEGATWHYGADWGFSVDPSTLVRIHINEDKRQIYIAEEAYQVGCEIDDLPALFDDVTEARKWIITADSARPETISYMKRKGFRIKAAKKGAGSVEDGIEFLKSYDIIINPRCKHAISEFTYYRYKVDLHTNEVLPVLIDANNHIIDATRYALEAIWRRRGKVRIAIG